MRTVLRLSLILAMLFVTVPGCGSDANDALIGEWAGKCTTTDQDGSRIADDVDATLRFTEDGRFSQSISDNEVDGTYSVSNEALALQAEGESTNVNYAIKDEGLTITQRETADGTTATSTCKFSRSS